MRRLLLVAVAALVVCAPAAAAPPPYGIVEANAPPGTPLLQLGRSLYAGNCSTCHGSNGQGIPVPRVGSGQLHSAGPSLRGVGARAADFYLRTGRMPLEHVGDEPMRSQVVFTDREIRALTAYVASLGHGPPIPQPQPEQGSVSEGMSLFGDHCAGCHQIAGAGGYLTGALAPPLGDATAIEIAEAVRIGPFVMPRFSKGQISDRQLNSIIRYVLYARHPNDAGGWSLNHIGPIPEGLVTWLIAAVVLVATCLVIGTRLKKS
jgi:quinol---cytochrome-c reductase cytochrome c subunit